MCGSGTSSGAVAGQWCVQMEGRVAAKCVREQWCSGANGGTSGSGVVSCIGSEIRVKGFSN